MVVSVFGWMFGWLLVCLDGSYCVGMDVWMVVIVLGWLISVLGWIIILLFLIKWRFFSNFNF
jgi:hypothetical protein